MADDYHHHHHRPNPISVRPPAAASPNVTPKPRTRVPLYPSSIPTPEPSKHRLSITRASAGAASRSSVPSLLLLLFFLRSLYSLLPFLRSSPPSFSIFPFAFLVSLFSFVLTLGFFFNQHGRSIFSLNSLTQPQRRFLLAKSLLLAVVFLLKFQALRYCGTAAMILAEIAGNVAALIMQQGKEKSSGRLDSVGSFKIRGFISLFSGLILLSISWDRVECFPFSPANIGFFQSLPSGNCLRIGSILLPLFSGFLGYFERASSNLHELRELGQKKVRLITLFFTTVILLIPAAISMFVFEVEGDSISLSGLAWPLANTVVFGVLLNENHPNEKGRSSKLSQKEYLIAFFCMFILEMFYFTELSTPGLLISGFFIWISVRDLNLMSASYPELGYHSSETYIAVVMKSLRHIFSERKSRKIALFLLINTAYMVVEFVVGFMSNSLGLISDACHMLFDCAALAIGLYASYIARLPANSRHNYGRGRFEVLSGFVNAVFLVLVGAMITLESLERILDPQEVSTGSLMAVSVGGLVVNIIGLLFFHEEHHHAHGGLEACSHSHIHSHDFDEKNNLDHHHHDHHEHCENHDHSHDHEHSHHHHHHDHVHRHWESQKGEHQKLMVVDSDEKNDGKGEHDHSHHRHCENHGHDRGGSTFLEKRDRNSHHHHHGHIDHNMQGIFLHVLADTLGSVGVVISTLLIKYKGWLAADPACSIFISALIVSSVIPLLTNSAEVLLQRVPRSCERGIKQALSDVMRLRGVCDVQNLRIWSFTNTEVVGTLHVLVSKDADKDSVKRQVGCILRDAGVKDLTVQIVLERG